MWLQEEDIKLGKGKIEQREKKIFLISRQMRHEATHYKT